MWVKLAHHQLQPTRLSEEVVLKVIQDCVLSKKNIH